MIRLEMKNYDVILIDKQLKYQLRQLKIKEKNRSRL